MPEKSAARKTSAARRSSTKPGARAGKPAPRPGKPAAAKSAAARDTKPAPSRNGKPAAAPDAKRAAKPAAPSSSGSAKPSTNAKPARSASRRADTPVRPAKPVTPPREKAVGAAPANIKPAKAPAVSRGKVAARRPVIAPEPVVFSGDSGLNRKDLEMFREMLLEKRSQLVGDMSTMRDEALRSNSQSSGDLSSMPIHMADLGTDNFEQEFTLGLIEGGQQELREIDAALDRIEKRTYGLCLATGKPIGKARLKAQPWAKYCYEYMLEQERGKIRRY